MRLRFIGQPFADSDQIGNVLAAALRAGGASSMWVATAWAKRSGIGRIQAPLADFRASGGASEIVVGIDEGGATREGLELCLEIFDRAFIYHDPGTRTFHPKIYSVETVDHATVIIGSGNLTKGGLYTNYEAAFILDVERDDPEWAIRDEVRSFFDALLGAGEAIRPLDTDLITVLAEEGWVTSEARQNRRRAAESRQRGDRRRLFGNAVTGLAGAPPPTLPALPDEEEDEDTPLPAAPPTGPASPVPPAAGPTTPAPAPAPDVLESWSKVLAAGDAQHPANPQTNPTGVLRLNQARHRDSTGTLINHLVWFRRVLFASANWAADTDANGNAIEVATVPMKVTLRGVSQGIVSLIVDHGPHREAGQGNVPTILHWGALLPELRRVDYTGSRVTISSLSDGSFELEIG